MWYRIAGVAVWCGIVGIHRGELETEPSIHQAGFEQERLGVVYVGGRRRGGGRVACATDLAGFRVRSGPGKTDATCAQAVSRELTNLLQLPISLPLLLSPSLLGSTIPLAAFLYHVSHHPNPTSSSPSSLQEAGSKTCESSLTMLNRFSKLNNTGNIEERYKGR